MTGCEKSEEIGNLLSRRLLLTLLGLLFEGDIDLVKARVELQHHSLIAHPVAVVGG